MELLVENLKKRFGANQALDGVSFRSEYGIIGLLGSNGAGKTTLLRILATLLRPSEGKLSWGTFDYRQTRPLRNLIGYLPQDFGIYPEFTARQFLRYIANLKGLHGQGANRRIDELLEKVELSAVADRKLGGFSGGMKQRVGVAQALLNDPQLLIADEPTSGLDPEQRVQFRSLLSSLTLNRLVILSSHIIGDIEAISSRLVILKKGRLQAFTTPADILAQAKGKVWQLETDLVTYQRLATVYQVSRMVNLNDINGNRVALRLVGEGRPHEKAEITEASMEDACILAMNN
jgi:ABC-type multidrug transport system ATPase subunit